MPMHLDDIVMHPAYAPYPWYGRVVKIENGDHVSVTQVRCGDPRCSAEHRHADQVWRNVDLLNAVAFQPQAAWEYGRTNSPNAPALW